MSPPDDLRRAARLLREAGHGGWFLDLARWLERVARDWPNQLVITSTRQAATERNDALGIARAITSDARKNQEPTR